MCLMLLVNAFFKHEIQKGLSDNNENNFNVCDYGNDDDDDEMFYESKEYSLYIDEFVYNVNQRRKYMKEWRSRRKVEKKEKRSLLMI